MGRKQNRPVEGVLFDWDGTLIDSYHADASAYLAMFKELGISWGLEDRSAFVRVKGGSPKSRHFENRAPTGLSNPYLASAALLGAGLLGIIDELELEPPARKPAEEDETKPKLPSTVEESLLALEGDEQIVELLGEEFVTAYAVMRRYELQRLADHVTDWELQEYLELY